MGTREDIFFWISEKQSSDVSWLWYPYIPYGKICVLQGDPGCGKSMLMTDIIAKLTSGKMLPDGKRHEPINVIYQCSEDGIEDTIKPRLEKAGADCSKVACIDEDLVTLTLNDDKIEQAIKASLAKLIVIDPFQAYVGDSDLSNVTGMRRIMRQLGTWASNYNCAVVMVGHLNKKSGQKELYRGLGSVDIIASARSVIQVERIEDNPRLRIMRHVKSSLSSPGESLIFEISEDGSFRWIPNETYEAARQRHFKEIYSEDENAHSKIITAGHIMLQMLAEGPVAAADITEIISDKGIGERTIKSAKKKMGIVSFRKNGQWYWNLPGNEVSAIAGTSDCDSETEDNTFKEKY